MQIITDVSKEQQSPHSNLQQHRCANPKSVTLLSASSSGTMARLCSWFWEVPLCNTGRVQGYWRSLSSGMWRLAAWQKRIIFTVIAARTSNLRKKLMASNFKYAINLPCKSLRNIYGNFHTSCDSLRSWASQLNCMTDCQSIIKEISFFIPSSKQSVVCLHPQSTSWLHAHSLFNIYIPSFHQLFSVATDGIMCHGVDSASKNKYQENSWG